jgi:exonuclease SbcD
MTRILHTADWHIGKHLHKQELAPDLEMFFEWLIKTIHDERIDVLLVSGDIFDLANPSNVDEAQYFKTLSRLIGTGIKTIITGGNHDSVSLLDAPTPILDHFNIIVVGGARLDLNQEIMPIYDKDNQLDCCVLAVPFLREKDLRQANKADQFIDRHAMIKESIILRYRSLVQLARETYGENIPIIAMGHLFMSGSITSESERDIHVGTLDALKDDWIDDCGIDYMALGHIHKPQRIGKRDHVRYCGSPVFLDFSEREYQKQCIIFDVDESQVKNIRSVAIPVFRKMLKLSGNFNQITNQLLSINDAEKLPSFVELEIYLEGNDIEIIRELENFIVENPSDKYIILKQKFVSLEGIKNNLQDKNDKSINDLDPMEVFDQRLSSEDLDDVFKSQLKSCYQDVLESFTS